MRFSRVIENETAPKVPKRREKSRKTPEQLERRSLRVSHSKESRKPKADIAPVQTSLRDGPDINSTPARANGGRSLIRRTRTQRRLLSKPSRDALSIRASTEALKHRLSPNNLPESVKHHEQTPYRRCFGGPFNPSLARGEAGPHHHSYLQPTSEQHQKQSKAGNIRTTILLEPRATSLALDTTAAIRFFLLWRRLRPRSAHMGEKAPRGDTGLSTVPWELVTGGRGTIVTVSI